MFRCRAVGGESLLPGGARPQEAQEKEGGDDRGVTAGGELCAAAADDDDDNGEVSALTVALLASLLPLPNNLLTTPHHTLAPALCTLPTCAINPTTNI